VSDHIAEVMLGVDWLAENNVIWDFRRAQIQLGGRVHSLYHQRRVRKSCVERDWLCHDRTANLFVGPADQVRSNGRIVAAVRTRDQRRRSVELEEGADRVGGNPNPDPGVQSTTRHQAGPPGDFVLP